MLRKISLTLLSILCIGSTAWTTGNQTDDIEKQKQFLTQYTQGTYLQGSNDQRPIITKEAATTAITALQENVADIVNIINTLKTAPNVETISTAIQNNEKLKDNVALQNAISRACTKFKLLKEVGSSPSPDFKKQITEIVKNPECPPETVFAAIQVANRYETLKCLINCISEHATLSKDTAVQDAIVKKIKLLRINEIIPKRQPLFDNIINILHDTPAKIITLVQIANADTNKFIILCQAIANDRSCKSNEAIKNAIAEQIRTRNIIQDEKNRLRTMFELPEPCNGDQDEPGKQAPNSAKLVELVKNENLTATDESLIIEIVQNPKCPPETVVEAIKAATHGLQHLINCIRIHDKDRPNGNKLYNNQAIIDAITNKIENFTDPTTDPKTLQVLFNHIILIFRANNPTHVITLMGKAKDAQFSMLCQAIANDPLSKPNQAIKNAIAEEINKRVNINQDEKNRLRKMFELPEPCNGDQDEPGKQAPNSAPSPSLPSPSLPAATTSPADALLQQSVAHTELSSPAQPSPQAIINPDATQAQPQDNDEERLIKTVVDCLQADNNNLKKYLEEINNLSQAFPKIPAQHQQSLSTHLLNKLNSFKDKQEFTDQEMKIISLCTPLILPGLLKTFIKNCENTALLDTMRSKCDSTLQPVIEARINMLNPQLATKIDTREPQQLPAHASSSKSPDERPLPQTRMPQPPRQEFLPVRPVAVSEPELVRQDPQNPQNIVDRLINLANRCNHGEPEAHETLVQTVNEDLRSLGNDQDALLRVIATNNHIIMDAINNKITSDNIPAAWNSDSILDAIATANAALEAENSPAGTQNAAYPALQPPMPADMQNRSFANQETPRFSANNPAKSAIWITAGFASLTGSAITSLISTVAFSQIDSLEEHIASLIGLLASDLAELKFSSAEMQLIKNIKSERKTDPMDIHSAMHKAKQVEELRKLLHRHSRITVRKNISLFATGLALGAGAICLAVHKWFPHN